MSSSSHAGASTVVLSTSILGKRKASRKVDSFVLHLASGSETGNGPSDSDFEPLQSPTGDTHPPLNPPIIVNGTLVPHTTRRYKCTHIGCDKAYTKPSRLEEHQRSHTGQRPFICDTCNKSYLRETHLHAHARSHLPESARPLACPEGDCSKRFWTSQHLRVHMDLHRGAKPFPCLETACDEAFAKHHQLRSHMSSVHAPPGTKPYRCEHEGCTKSFVTNQHLRTHSKVHDEKRYTCVHPNCVAELANTPTYFSTWTALQHHLRTVHPPTCTYLSCNGRTFSSQRGFRAHLKLHEEHEVEVQLDMAAAELNGEGDKGEDRPRKKRRGGELGREWKCEAEGCGKDFKSKKALTTHTEIIHLGQRNHVCPHEDCQRAFGYKHLLQRHLLKVHVSSDSASDESFSDESDFTEDERPRQCKAMPGLDIDMITGNAYAMRARKKLQEAKALQCPYPYLMKTELMPSHVEAAAETTGTRSLCEPDCEYVFSRAYDLRRHMKSVHKIVAEKEQVNEWVETVKQGRC